MPAVPMPAGAAGEPSSGKEPGGGPVISVENLSYAFGAGANRRQVLDHVTMSVDASEVVLLSGPSGSGKSTLVNDILGVLLFDFAGAVQRGAGKGHETCVILVSICLVYCNS